MRIEVGYGLEGALPDITCNKSFAIKYRLRHGDFDAGVANGIAIIGTIGGEYTAGDLWFIH